jgi:hypothetical protein
VFIVFIIYRDTEACFNFCTKEFGSHESVQVEDDGDDE